MVAQFLKQTNIPAQRILLKKNRARGAVGENTDPASAFYYPDPVFYFKKYSCKSYCLLLLHPLLDYMRSTPEIDHFMYSMHSWFFYC